MSDASLTNIHMVRPKGPKVFSAVLGIAAHGIAGITVTGDSSDVTVDHAWAVFSVGDLGMPPKVTVDIEQTVLPLPAPVQVLRAAFKQERLANTLFAENQLPMDAVELHATIQVAVDLHGAYAMIDRRILTLDRGTSTTVSDNPEISDSNLRFTADGTAVVFTSHYDGTDRTEHVGRWAAVSGGQ